MTAQLQERFIMNNNEYGIASLPLTSYLNSLESLPDFRHFNSAIWRKYMGTWELKNNKLFLINLYFYAKSDYSDDMYEKDLSALFPNQNEVFASWFTGDLRIPEGEIIEYVNAGFASKYEQDLFLSFKNGVFVEFKTVYNSKKTSEKKKKKKQNSFFDFIKLIFSNRVIPLFNVIKF